MVPTDKHFRIAKHYKGQHYKGPPIFSGWSFARCAFCRVLLSTAHAYEPGLRSITRLVHAPMSSGLKRLFVLT
jgi:hypothetical protein